ncbi:hypothetical protein ACFQ5M_02920 [Agrilactobacillus yilanensis]|uniref:DUF1659 domain-containing protein n=1 Tax=Agrilactobacillus yilanensis TaxID=2485997 RepID=A0ABW4J6E0_9LACO|nr:hypothetical protein [Agrilactobacillus yilanensis]
MALNWNGTTLNYTLAGDHYPHGKKMRQFKNVVKNPDEAKVSALGATLASFGEADELVDSEIVTRHSVVTD